MVEVEVLMVSPVLGGRRLVGWAAEAFPGIQDQNTL